MQRIIRPIEQVHQPEGKFPTDLELDHIMEQKRLQAKQWMVEKLDREQHPLILDYAKELEDAS